MRCLKTVKIFIHTDFQRRTRWWHFAEIMVFYEEEKAVLKNDFLERGWMLLKFVRSIQQKVGTEFPSIDF